MGLPRHLVKLEQALRASGGIDLFAPMVSGGLPDSPEANAVVGRLVELGFQDSDRVLRLCLQALSVLHDDMAPQLVAAELVATLPPEMPGIARTTGQVVREMLRPDADEVIVVGYELTDQDTIQLLADSSSRGANVIMICDRSRGAGQRLSETWPSDVRPPRVFQNRERADGARYASMHAKCLLVDGKDLLVTSANFTFHGLHGNIEIGVRLSGPLVVEARKIFSHLVESRIVEEV